LKQKFLEKDKMNKSFLSLGSNLGDRLNYLEKAIDLLKKTEGVNIIKISSVYETEPVGYKEQPSFLNLVVEIETEIEPEDLLKRCKEIESSLGRTKREKWREREIDIDIIFYNNLIIEKDYIVIPHKELYYRKFVLLPLCEIDPDFICPKTKKSIRTLFNFCNDSSIIKVFNNKIQCAS